MNEAAWYDDYEEWELAEGIEADYIQDEFPEFTAEIIAFYMKNFNWYYNLFSNNKI